MIGTETRGGGLGGKGGVWRKGVVILHCFAQTHTHAQAAPPTSLRRPASQEPEYAWGQGLRSVSLTAFWTRAG